MLKFLTHKLRTHSLNEDPNQEKTDDDHDSGTESDDELQVGSEDPPSFMESVGTPGPPDSAVPSDTDLGAPCIPSKIGFANREDIEDVVNDDGIVSLQAQTQSQQSGLQSNQFQATSSNDGCITGAAVAACGSSGVSNTASQSRRADLLLLLNYNDQHSSEEELEVINSPRTISSQSCRPATAPEKRKWSQVSCGSNHARSPSQTQLQLIHHSQTTSAIVGGATSSAPASRAGREPAGSGSSDEEVQGLLGDSMSQPVQFRTSPPVDAHKPGRSLSPPPKLFHASVRDPRPPRPRSRPRPHPLIDHLDADPDALSACSPRKRHRPPHRLPRPCLDFEKMQQLKARAVTAWRHSGEHGSELSVFCW
ncbi:uncharacterized protein LOC105684858 [Athalia rosae]|uniref:uncharacterized protein LOC105684858 n=1 Tax=Athalia rosae TaxID=37344 RepID=UPI0006252638|nr:uncharacterized protein LOC105684858 [Athalia rosae]XP_048507068.1 uncharacterized protein LOC105684858 [Athalia rosae]